LDKPGPVGKNKIKIEEQEADQEQPGCSMLLAYSEVVKRIVFPSPANQR